MDEVVAIFGMLAPTGWVLIALACAPAFLLGWAICRYASYRRSLWLGLAAALPFCLYLVAFLVLPPSNEGTQFGWFMAGLAMISPIIVVWVIALALGYFARARLRGTSSGGIGV